MAGAGRQLGKKATDLTGLYVLEHPHEKLTKLYSLTLRLLSRMPLEAGYRQSTEAIVKSRMHLVNTEPDTATLAQKINCGLIEEVVSQAEYELRLSRNMLEWKPWLPLVAEAPKTQWQWPIA